MGILLAGEFEHLAMSVQQSALSIEYSAIILDLGNERSQHAFDFYDSS
jgi:hypothetical protein